MRLLYCITKSEHGGAQVHLGQLLRAFSSEYELVLASGDEGFVMSEADALGIRRKVFPTIVGPLHPYKDVAAVRDLARFIRSERIDLVHAHSSKAGVVARFAGIPSVFTAHGWAFTEGVPILRKVIASSMEGLTAPFTSRIITVSECDRRLALRHRIAAPERLVTVWNGVDDVPERARPGEIAIPVIAVVARLAPPKAHTDLLQVLSRIREPWRLVLVGDGPLAASLRKLSTKLGLDDRVRFLGVRDDVPAILASSHIFCLPSNWEGFPLSILEGMRAGLPVVASEVGGVSEAVTQGENGFLYPRNALDSLERYLRELLQSPRLRERMGRAGRHRFEQLFTVQRMVDATRGVYEEVMGLRSGRVADGATQRDEAA